ncbi:MAG: phosphonate metabolism protein/1,5-bisphosphokinase (PRPP-forming) PhnN [Pseudomonadota bacterium]|nr:phosphonate metabolism protein/1,5-bisphosphokinase (PRPP-forming) PhnN [Pseudomonadota bacterium]
MLDSGERLIYVMGPSGAGKDSVLQWAREHLPATKAGLPLHWARRTITRAPTDRGEQHESVSVALFHQLAHDGAFALQWEANQTSYGIRTEALAPLAWGDGVIVNGSRAHCPQALARFPRMKLVHVTASAATLRERLLARGRESADAVEQRLSRLAGNQPPAAHLEIVNDGALADAGRVLLDWLQAQESRKT